MKASEAFKFVILIEIAVMLGLAVVGAGLLISVFAPHWLVGWLASLVGPEPKAFWYLSRIAGLVSYSLISLAVILGLSITNKLARVWPGGPAAVDLHQFTTLLGLSLAAFHVFILLGDRYIGYSLGELLIPFASTVYRPLWVGLGQLGLYFALPLALSFYIRQWIGYGLWRTLHYASFGVYGLVTAHGLLAGTDAQNPIVLALYLVTCGAVASLTVYRLRSAALQPSRVRL